MIGYGRKVLSFIIPFSVLLLSGCVKASPTLSSTPEPVATVTPAPELFHPVLTAEPLDSDLFGKIIDDENHYYHYLSFGDIRIYEYETGTFLDGICVNAYAASLDGKLSVVYKNEEGKVCGYGLLHTTDGGTVLKPGSNAIYAEIGTDINVTQMPFTFEIVEAYRPVD